MQNVFMIGQIAISIGERDEQNNEQNVTIINPRNEEAAIEPGNTDTVPAAANNISAVAHENRNSHESDEKGGAEGEVNTVGLNSQPESSTRKRKQAYRHTKPQIEAMEEFFNNVSPNPDGSQRQDLARKHNLDPAQVKFWFQNRRTHIKSKNEHKNNSELRQDNEMLAAQNLSCKQALSGIPCGECGASPAIILPTGLQQLRVQNKTLLEEIEGLKRMLSDNHLSSNVNASTNTSTGINISQCIASTSGNTVCNEYIAYRKQFVESNEPLVRNVATASMEELINKIDAGERLWFPNGAGNMYFLNMQEYFKAFPASMSYGYGSDQWTNEGSLQYAFVTASPLHIVDVFTNVEKWNIVYPDFISKATSIYKLPGSDGDLQLVCVEFHAPCPAIPTREVLFIRYCKQLTQKRWVIADVSLDSILTKLPADPSINCLRWPSGCIIEELANGHSKVTWVEHVVANNEFVHPLVEPVIRSGVVFGAMRWVSIFQRQCERIEYTMPQTNRGNMDGGVAVQEQIILNLSRLSERTCRQYFGGATTSVAYGWRYLSGNGVNDVRIMKKDTLNGMVVSASLCVHLRIQPEIVFDFLRNTSTRIRWDPLCNGSETFEETISVPTGQNGNGVSVLRVDGREDMHNMFIVQETITEPASSSIIYTYLQGDPMMSLQAGDGNPDNIGIQPSGFTVIPTKQSESSIIAGHPISNSLVETFLSGSFQLTISPLPYANIPYEAIEQWKSIAKKTLENITDALVWQ